MEPLIRRRTVTRDVCSQENVVVLTDLHSKPSLDVVVEEEEEKQQPKRKQLNSKKRTSWPSTNLLLHPVRDSRRKKKTKPNQVLTMSRLQLNLDDLEDDFHDARDQFDPNPSSCSSDATIAALSPEHWAEYEDSCTQDCSQPLYQLRLVLHPDVDTRITKQERDLLVQAGLHTIDIGVGNPYVNLGREKYARIFDKSGINTKGLSRVHCSIEMEASSKMKNRNQYEVVSIVDHSSNGLHLNGMPMQKNVKVPLKHGDKVSLLTSSNGTIILGYYVEDPFIIGANRGFYSNNDAPTLRKNDLAVDENVLGVLFSSPLVGRGQDGILHKLDQLDLNKEYYNLTHSLTEAVKIGTRARPEDGLKSDEVLMPQSIKLSIKFATTAAFREIVTAGCRAIHFSGHGNENCLYFEDGVGSVHPVLHDDLKKQFEIIDDSGVRLVFVSACSSAPLAPAFLNSGVPHVVAVKLNEKIEDQAAIEFTRAFYFALIRGKTVQCSFGIGQQAVSSSPLVRVADRAAAKFQLLPEGADHSEVIYPAQKISIHDLANVEPPRSLFPALWPNDIPSVCQGFFNRTNEVFELCNQIMQIRSSTLPRLFNVIGAEGIGKTQIAHAVATYVGVRRIFEGGVLVVSVPDIIKLLKLKEPSDQMDISDDIHPSDDRVLSAIQRKITKHEAEVSMKRKHLYDKDCAMHMLIVLDGCDYYTHAVGTKPNEAQAAFLLYLSKLLSSNSSLRLLLTCRRSISMVPDYSSSILKARNFNFDDSAVLLLNVASSNISRDEMQKSNPPQPFDLCSQKTLVAYHPAVIQTGGNPRRIMELAFKLNSATLDSLDTNDETASL